MNTEPQPLEGIVITPEDPGAAIGRTPGHVLGEFLEHAEALLKILARADRQEFPGLSLKHHFDTAGKLEMVHSWIEQADGLRASERTPATIERTVARAR